MLTYLRPPVHTHLSALTCPHASRGTHPPVTPFLVLPGPANPLPALDPCPLSLTPCCRVFGPVGSSGLHRPAGPDPPHSAWSACLVRSDPAAPTSQRLQDGPQPPSPPPTSSHARSLSVRAPSTPGPRPVPPPPPPAWAEPAPLPLTSAETASPRGSSPPRARPATRLCLPSL